MGITSARTALLVCMIGVAAPSAFAQQATAPGIGTVAVEVRMMNQGELQSRYDVETLSAAAAGVFSLPRSLVAAVSAPGNAPTPEGPPGTTGYQPHRDVAMGLIGQSLFPIQLDGALRQRLGSIARADGIPGHLGVAIGFYGLQSRESRPSVLREGDDFCFVFRAVATVTLSGQPAREEKVERGVAALSAGMPAPRCAAMRDLADGGGILLREAMRESAESAADWIVTNIVQPQ